MTDLRHMILRYETPRLVLQTLTRENASPDYLAWVSDPEVTRFLEIRHTPQTPETVNHFIETMHASPVNILLGIFLKAKKKHIGNVKIGPINPRYGRADIGLLLGDKNSWGKGYATEAIEGICTIAKEILGLRRLQSGAYAHNTASISVFEKAGFVEEGRYIQHWSLDGKPEDGLTFGKIL